MQLYYNHVKDHVYMIMHIIIQITLFKFSNIGISQVVHFTDIIDAVFSKQKKSTAWDSKVTIYLYLLLYFLIFHICIMNNIYILKTHTKIYFIIICILQPYPTLNIIPPLLFLQQNHFVLVWFIHLSLCI